MWSNVETAEQVVVDDITVSRLLVRCTSPSTAEKKQAVFSVRSSVAKCSL